MTLSLLATLFVLLIAAFWAFQGLFSSALMLIESIVAVMVAFGFYEPLASTFSQHVPELAEPIALMALFLATLVALRLVTDLYLTGSAKFPMPIDRAGGGLLGLLSGLICIGTVLVAIQMLPLGRDILGFSRLDPRAPARRNSIWLNPDGFVVGLVNMLSSGRFGGASSFPTARPEFLTDLAAINLGVQTESRRAVPSSCLTVQKYWRVDSVDAVEQQQSGDKWTRTFSKVAPDDPSRKFLVVRVQIDGVAADVTEEAGAVKMVRFTPAQWRIVGRGSDGRASGWAMASALSDIFSEKENYVIDATRAGRLVKWPLDQHFGLSADNGKHLLKDGRYLLDVAFEVPADFEPWFIEFKHGARVELTKALSADKPQPWPLSAPAPARPAAKPAAKQGGKPKADQDEETEADEEEPAKPAPKKPASDDEEEEEEAEGEPPSKPAAKKPTVGEKQQGRTNVASAIEERTGVSPKLPVRLKRSDFPTSALRGGKFAEGHIVVNSPGQGVKRSDEVSEFLVPNDLRLLQIGAEATFAGSTLGQALEFAKRAVSQIFVTADDGATYFAIGVYTAATINGKRVLEIQYWPEADVPERALQPPKTLKPNLLRTAADQSDLKMGFLFLVPPGTHIVKFNTSPRGGQTVDIEVPE